MKRIIGFLCVLLSCSGIHAQNIGDTVTEKLTKKYRTKSIDGAQVTFREKNLILKVNKQDLIEVFNDTSDVSPGLLEDYERAKALLRKNDSLIFENFWTSNPNQSKELIVLQAVIKEAVCPLIEKGRFELFEDTQKISNYYIEWTGNESTCRGALTPKKRLFWICMPCFVE